MIDSYRYNYVCYNLYVCYRHTVGIGYLHDRTGTLASVTYKRNELTFVRLHF